MGETACPTQFANPLHGKEGGADGFVCRANFSHLLSSTLSIFELHRIGPWLRVMNRAVGDFNAIGNEEKRRVQ